MRYNNIRFKLLRNIILFWYGNILSKSHNNTYYAKQYSRKDNFWICNDQLLHEEVIILLRIKSYIDTSRTNLSFLTFFDVRVFVLTKTSDLVIKGNWCEVVWQYSRIHEKECLIHDRDHHSKWVEVGNMCC
jgi:hypothetical protein